jgi:hypothetical protein
MYHYPTKSEAVAPQQRNLRFYAMVSNGFPTNR